MKKLLTLSLLLSATYSFAQNNDANKDAIAINTNFYSFNQTLSDDYAPYTPPRGRNCVNGMRVVANVLAFSGGALIGWPLGAAIGGGDPEWYLAGIGAGLVAIAIPLDIAGKKRCGRYTMLKTAEMPYYAFSNKNSLRVGGSAGRVGLTLNF